jgi:hypothetical protein
MPFEFFIQFFQNPLVQALVWATVFLLGIAILAQFLHSRQRWLLNSYQISIPDAPAETVNELKSVRQQLWKQWSQDRQLNRQQWQSMIRKMVGAVATHFHPTSDNPEEKVNLGQLLQHAEGLNRRLARLLHHPKLGVFRDLSIGDIDAWYKRLNSLYKNRLFRFFSNKYLRRTFEFIFVFLSSINPFAIGRRLTTSVGIEVATRYFFSAFFAIIAEESWNMFTDEKGEEDQEEYEYRLLLALSRSMKELSLEEYNFLASTLAGSTFSDKQYFAFLDDVVAGSDKGKSLDKMRKKPLLHYPEKELDEFSRLSSGDELAKLTNIRSLRKQWQEGQSDA